MRKKIKSEKGQVIVENLFCILLVCLIFFGIMQLFMMFIADSVTRYSAFVATRSHSVGFRDRYALRGAKIATIPASGRRIEPSNLGRYNNNSYGLGLLLDEYIRGQRFLEYEYWDGDNEFGPNQAPFKEQRDTYLSLRSSSFNTTVKTEVKFNDYPMALPMRMINFGTEYTDIEGEATFPNYASKFLE